MHWLCYCCGIEKAEESKLLQPLLPEDHSGSDLVEDAHTGDDDDEDEHVRTQPSAGTYCDTLSPSSESSRVESQVKTIESVPMTRMTSVTQVACIREG